MTRFREDLAYAIGNHGVRLMVTAWGEPAEAEAMADRLEPLRDLPVTEWLVESLLLGAALGVYRPQHDQSIPLGPLDHLREQCRRAQQARH